MRQIDTWRRRRRRRGREGATTRSAHFVVTGTDEIYTAITATTSPLAFLSPPFVFLFMISQKEEKKHFRSLNRPIDKACYDARSPIPGGISGFVRPAAEPKPGERVYGRLI